jgi:hypothetical protein
VKLGFGDLTGHAFRLVDGDHDGLRLAPQPLGHGRILRREPALVIDDEHDGVGFLDRDRDLLGDERGDCVAVTRDEAARVDDDELALGRAADAVAAIAREAGVVGD